MTANLFQLQNYLKVAKEAALRASVILNENFGKLEPSMIDEKAKNDFVTDVDRKAEEIIKNHIHAHFKDHSMLAEESPIEKRSSPFLWIIDPLDGTSNYIHRIPIFAISIALEIEGELAVGLIYEPQRKNLFSSIRGLGALKNDQPIRVSQTDKLSTSLIATGFPFRIKDILDTYLSAFKELFMRASGIRRCGSAALDLAYTTEGIFGGFFECLLSPWDMAAGALLVKEAGGAVTDFHGGDQYLKTGNIIAGSKQIHNEILKIIQNTFG
ncbi:MAG: inositol monophosphatase [Candidatus Brocadiaceae bacterium]|nr:inositol monophosphatase [Candidatus Brocadiaceae bacterium]